MDRYKVISFNVRGLNSPFKRTKVLDFLHRKNIGIALLQETHLKPTDSLRLQNKRYKTVATSSDGTSTKGIAVIMRRNLKVNILKVSSSASGRLAYFAKDMNLIDLWRVQNPTSRDYTYYSPRHKSFSRIDYMLISSEMVSASSSMNLFPRHISDHNPIDTTFNFQMSKKLQKF